MAVSIRELTASDYDQVVELWMSTEGVGLSEADSRGSIGQFLLRNPGLSHAAWDAKTLVGAVLCGHDGRRGYIHHLVVRASHRRQGIGRLLVERCLAALRANNINKCHLFVFVDNQSGIAFWKRTGWGQRNDLTMMSHYTNKDSQQ